MKKRDKDLHDKIGKSIARARKAAPKDNATFLLELRDDLAVNTMRRRGPRALSGESTKQHGPMLDDDPRYLANLRALAERQSNARIVGGSEVEGAEFHDCVAVGSDTQFGCTGTLIAPNVVLTAAHCQALHTRVFVGNDLSKKGKQFRVRKHIRHKAFDSQFQNDLMILILEKAVPGVTPRRLATGAVINGAKTARIVGFGTTDVNASKGFGVKRKTDVPIVSQGCRGKVNGKSDASVYKCHLDREIVAGKPFLLEDTCKGDSGGPLFVQDAKGNWVLAGVTSRGTGLATTMCGDGGLYVRVDKYAKWIADAMKSA